MDSKSWPVVWFCIFAPLLFSACVIGLFRMAEFTFTPLDRVGDYTPVFTPGAVLAVSLITGYIFSLMVALHHFKRH